MEISEIYNISKRNYKLEKKMIKDFSNILNGYITNQEVQDRIERNCPNGIHIVEPKIFGELNRHDIAFYSSKDGIILIKSNEYKKNPTILANHELGHAFLNEQNRTAAEIDSEIYQYGFGIEEGAMSVLSILNKIDKINITTTPVYKYQSLIFLQLNELYKKVVDEYPNLLIHILKSEESFCNLVRRIYENIITNDDYLVLRSALALVVGSDLITEEPLSNNYYIKNCTLFINKSYFSIINNNLKMGEWENPLFGKFSFSKEEQLMRAIFGNELLNQTFYNSRKEEISKVSEKVFNLIENKTYHI